MLCPFLPRHHSLSNSYMLTVIHNSLSGRIRLKISLLYHSEYLKSELLRRLAETEWIESAKASTITATVLILFKRELTHQHVIDYVNFLLKELVPQFTSSNGNSHSIKPKGNANNSQKQSLTQKKLRRLVINAEAQSERPYHTLETTKVEELFEVDRTKGLSPERASSLLKSFGPNVLPEAVPRSGWSIFFGQLKSLPVALLGVAATVSIFTGGLIDALIIAGVVLINATIGYVTEVQAERTIYALKNLVKPTAFVLRNGKAKEISAEEIVPGDLLLLKPGCYVAADARLLEASHLSVDESALTGESMPVLKDTAKLSDKNIPLADRTNMVYMGTLITGGQGLAVVVNTGRYTEIGKIQLMVGETRPPQTPMERQLEQIGTRLVYISGIVCVIVFFIGLLRGRGLLEMFKIAISLAVAAVPEGLPTVATTTLALGIKNMKRHNVLIRHLDAVETLGAVQTICLDKTGTLTLNKMTLTTIYSGMRYFKLFDGQYLYEDTPIDANQYKELQELLKVCVLCNESEVENQNGHLVVRGSSTENALIYAAFNAGIDVKAMRKQYPLLKIRHRSENCNIMVTMHSIKDGKPGQTYIAIKGSPNEVLALCQWHLVDGVVVPMNDSHRAEIVAQNEWMAGNALRVLGVAYAATGEIEGCDEPLHLCDLCDLPAHRQNFIWLGLTGMIDPIRKGVKELIAAYHEAGIDTIMITGDQVPTAYSIGKELNLSRGEQLEILDSTHLSEISPELLTALAQKVHVFARVSPANKLQIVQALQSAGKIVAMTGDGINDGPALKAADIGIAMGHTGTDVAREVSDVVIEDDNLETMIVSIRQGRTIYGNIRKSVRFLLSTNMSEIMVMFACITAGIGQPLSAMHLLWINLLSDIAPGLALSMEQPEPDIMKQPPRDPSLPIISTADFKRIALEASTLTAGSMSAYLYGIARYGIGQRASTLSFLSLSLAQIIHAYSCRSDKHSLFDKEKLAPNKYINWAVGGSFALQLLAIAFPPLRNLLGIAPLSLIDATVVGASTILPLLVNEGTKKINK